MMSSAEVAKRGAMCSSTGPGHDVAGVADMQRAYEKHLLAATHHRWRLRPPPAPRRVPETAGHRPGGGQPGVVRRGLDLDRSRCQRLAILQTASGRTTLAAEQLRPHRQRSPSASVTVGAGHKRPSSSRANTPIREQRPADAALEETLDMLAQCCGPGSRFAHLRDALQGGAHEHTEGHPHDAR
jgi:hypothetical protein